MYTSNVQVVLNKIFSGSKQWYVKTQTAQWWLHSYHLDVAPRERTVINCIYIFIYIFYCMSLLTSATTALVVIQQKAARFNNFCLMCWYSLHKYIIYLNFSLLKVIIYFVKDNFLVFAPCMYSWLERVRFWRHYKLINHLTTTWQSACLK